MAKTTTPKEGIFLRRNSKGFYITIKQNQHRIATLGGYNNRANAMKGLFALHKMLKAWAYNEHANSEVIDLAKPVKRKSK